MNSGSDRDRLSTIVKNTKLMGKNNQRRRGQVGYGLENMGRGKKKLIKCHLYAWPGGGLKSISELGLYEELRMMVNLSHCVYIYTWT